MSTLIDDLTSAKVKALQYSFLNQYLDWSNIESQAKNKYAQGISATISLNSGRPFDILQSLLAPDLSSLSGAYDFKTNLTILNCCIQSVESYMTPINKVALKNKLSNIGNASYWDTLGELWFVRACIKAGQNIEVDFPLHKPVNNNQPSDADIAIVDASGSPIWLLDAICPNLPEELKLVPNQSDFFDPNKAKSWLEEVIEKKYINKFSRYISNHVTARAAIIVVLIKADEVSVHLSPLLCVSGGHPISLNSNIKNKCPKLGYAVVVRFQKNSSKGNVEYVKLAELT